MSREKLLLEEQIRHALSQFLERLVEAIAEGLVPSKPGGRPPRRREVKFPEERPERTGE